MELTEKNAGQRVGVQVGEAVEVALAENPTTAYRWHPVESPGLDQVDDRYDGPTQPRGAAGTRRLTFRAQRPGPVRLRIVLQRSWQPDPVDEFTVDLDVTDEGAR